MKFTGLNKSIGALMLALTFSSGSLYAHTDEVLAQMPAPHGGQLRMAGPYHLELVATDKHTKVFVTDHAGTVQDMKTATATATVLSQGKKSKITFALTGNNEFSSKEVLPKSETTKVVVLVQPAGQAAQQASFTPFQKPAAHKHDHEQGHEHSHEQQHEHKHEHKH